MENSGFSSCDFEPKNQKPFRAFQKISDLRASNWSLKILKDLAGFFWCFCWCRILLQVFLQEDPVTEQKYALKQISKRGAIDKWQIPKHWPWKKREKKTPWFEVAGSFSLFLRLKKTDCFLLFSRKIVDSIFWDGQKVPWGGCFVFFKGSF